MRSLIRFAPCVLLALSTTTCREGPVAIRSSAANRLVMRIAPQLSAEARAGLRGLASASGSLGDLHIRVTHPPSAPLDTTVAFPTGSDSATFTLTVALASATEQLTITLTLSVGTTVYYSGSQVVTAAQGVPAVAPPIVMSYVGPSAMVSITPASATVRPGDTVRVAATPLDLAGHPITGHAVTYASSANSIAMVSATGLVTGLIGGNVTITATSDGKSGAATIAVQGPVKLSSVAIGADHSCGLTAAGTAYCWGSNGAGQLGDGTTTDHFAPGPVASSVVLAGLTLGAGQTCGLTAAGAAYCWGYNAFGQLGDGTTISRSTPGPVASGFVFRTLTARYLFTCGLTVAGAAYCWGDNTYGTLGDGTTIGHKIPMPVAGSLVFARLTAGVFHVCGLTAAGTAYCWGYNGLGNLGDGTTTDRPTPVQVGGGLVFSNLAAGEYHTCGLVASGAAYCWGFDLFGELGDGISTNNRSSPVPVGGGVLFNSLAAGDLHTCGLTAAGAAWCWGSNQYGQLGTTAANSSCVDVQFDPLPHPCSGAAIPVAGGLAFATLTVGFDHTCALGPGGAPYCWGRNINGQLGDGTTTDRSLPTPVKNP